jgi:alkylresorcinol/alkylpyrone synthase
MRDLDAAILSLATAVPDHVIGQQDVARHAAPVFGDSFRDYDRLAKVFETSGVVTRRSAMPLDWYLTERSFEERTIAYLAVAGDLFCAAAEKALAQAGLTARDIDTVVTVSSTGIATPSLEARMSDRAGFRPDVRRVPVFGVGCAGGVTGLAIAARLAAIEPGSRVLLVVVELCTLSARIDKPDKTNLVAVALFGDGAAAAVLESGAAPPAGMPTIRAASEHTWPGSTGIMGWDVDSSGFSVVLDKAVPTFVEQNVAAVVDRMLAGWSVSRGDVGRFVCHPGGAKVITALEAAMGAPEGSLDHEREVLRTFGNMSAPTVLFILRRALDAGLPKRAVATALGPGFTLSSALLETA